MRWVWSAGSEREVREHTWYKKTARSRRRIDWYSTSHSGHRRKRERSTYAFGMVWDGMKWAWMGRESGHGAGLDAEMSRVGRRAHSKRLGRVRRLGCEGSSVVAAP